MRLEQLFCFLLFDDFILPNFVNLSTPQKSVQNDSKLCFWNVFNNDFNDLFYSLHRRYDILQENVESFS